MDDENRKKIIRTIMCMHLKKCDASSIEYELHIAFPGVKTKKLINDSIDMYKSLINSIQLAGGDFGLTVDELDEWTLLDVIDRLSINNIRFVHVDGTIND